MESSLRLMSPCLTAAITHPKATGGTSKTRRREVTLSQLISSSQSYTKSSEDDLFQPTATKLALSALKITFLFELVFSCLKQAQVKQSLYCTKQTKMIKCKFKKGLREAKLMILSPPTLLYKQMHNKTSDQQLGAVCKDNK